MNCKQVIDKLKSLADADYLAGMSRYGVDTERARALGVSAPRMRKLAREIGKDHKLALELWKSGIHEARVIATLIEDVKKVTNSQINKWVPSMTAGLSFSVTVINTVPSVGNSWCAASCALKKARPKESAIPKTSPVDRISGPSRGSTSGNILNGKTASFTP